MGGEGHISNVKSLNSDKHSPTHLSNIIHIHLTTQTDTVCLTLTIIRKYFPGKIIYKKFCLKNCKTAKPGLQEGGAGGEQRAGWVLQHHPPGSDWILRAEQSVPELWSSRWQLSACMQPSGTVTYTRTHSDLQTHRFTETDTHTHRFTYRHKYRHTNTHRHASMPAHTCIVNVFISLWGLSMHF